MSIGIYLGMNMGMGSGGIPGTKTIVLDTFNRPNNASSLGTADTGQLWTPSLLTFGISGNKAYVSSGTGFGLALCNASADGIFQLDCTYATTNSTGLTFRCDGTSNNRWALFLASDSTTFKVSKIVGGVTSDMGTFSTSLVNGQTYRIKAVCSGSSIYCYLDGVLRFSLSDSALATLTQSGILVSKVAATPDATWDDFIVEAA